MSRVPGSNVYSAITIGQIMKRVIDSGKITRADELFFLRALTSDASLTSEDMATLTHLMKRLEMGLIKVVNE
jgi:hypothetical protein